MHKWLAFPVLALALTACQERETQTAQTFRAQTLTSGGATSPAATASDVDVTARISVTETINPGDYTLRIQAGKATFTPVVVVPPAPTPQTYRVEAETIINSLAAVRDETGASGGKLAAALVKDAGVTWTAPNDFVAGRYTLSTQGRGQAYNGSPVLSVKVNGTEAGTASLTTARLNVYGLGTLGGLLFSADLTAAPGSSGAVLLNDRGEALALLTGTFLPQIKLGGAFFAPLPH